MTAETASKFNMIFRADKTALPSIMQLTRTILRWLAAIFFIVAGTFHFLKPEMYLEIMPSYFPAPQLLVVISGIAEIAGGVGLLIRPLRRVAGWGLIALLLAIFPANIYMVQHPGQFHFAPWLLWARLPLQAVFIVWVWFAAIQPSPRK
ncbi:MAG TPA: MauE/DoxX family redox-associated membrane protein [Verrucomicrobiae bacterium]